MNERRPKDNGSAPAAIGKKTIVISSGAPATIAKLASIGRSRLLEKAGYPRGRYRAAEPAGVVAWIEQLIYVQGIIAIS